MNVEIGAEAALFLEKEYINVIAVAVRVQISSSISHSIRATVWFGNEEREGLVQIKWNDVGLASMLPYTHTEDGAAASNPSQILSPSPRPTFLCPFFFACKEK